MIAEIIAIIIVTIIMIVVNNKVNKRLSKKMTNSTAVEQKKDVPASKKDVNLGLKIPGSNWQMFKTIVTETSNERNSTEIQVKRKKHNRKHTQANKEATPKQQIQLQQKTEAGKKENEKKIKPDNGLTKVVAMDCENSIIVPQKKDVPANKKDTNLGLRIPGSNWQMFKTTVTETPNKTNSTENQVKRKRDNQRGYRFRKGMQESNGFTPKQQIQVQQQELVIEKKEGEKKIEVNSGLTKVVAMDCEMVGIGDGSDSMIARVSIVNRHGYCVYDKYVKPTEPVKDYRTAVSGIRPQHLEKGTDFKVVQKEVMEILRGRILVGHALHNDLSVLFLSHPRRYQRDTSRYKVFRKVTKGNTPSLKKLASELLGIDIQSGEHNSIEDARATMQIYQLFRKKWENDIRTKK